MTIRGPRLMVSKEAISEKHKKAEASRYSKDNKVYLLAKLKMCLAFKARHIFNLVRDG